jgi:hypothetical protein
MAGEFSPDICHDWDWCPGANLLVEVRSLAEIQEHVRGR